MLPKKKVSEEETPLLIGRLGTNLKYGIVGLPNVGKSTFFNVLTQSAVPAENVPFCTIDPSVARSAVPDSRFQWLVDFYKPMSAVPAFLNVVDTAGLVKGASEGKGLGNAFLIDIKACDAIFHIARAFEDDKVIHVEGEVNPVRDLDIIFNELRLKDLDCLTKQMAYLERTFLGGGDQKRKSEYDCLAKVKQLLEVEKKPVRFGKWDSTEIEFLINHMFITSKPIVYLVNLSEDDYMKENKWLAKLKAWVDEHDPGAFIIPWSAVLENKLAGMGADARKAYLEQIGSTSALDKIILTGFEALHLTFFFTTGEDEVRTWVVKEGTTVPKAGGRIHIDLDRYFTMAEVMKFDDFKEQGSEAAVKAAGKYYQKGREYVVQDGDIIVFKFNSEPV